jgi:hypothetical protein
MLGHAPRDVLGAVLTAAAGMRRRLLPRPPPPKHTGRKSALGLMHQFQWRSLRSLRSKPITALLPAANYAVDSKMLRCEEGEALDQSGELCSGYDRSRYQRTAPLGLSAAAAAAAAALASCRVASN